MAQQPIQEGTPLLATGEQPYDMSKAEDWGRALKDVAPQTALLSLVTGGVGTAAGGALELRKRQLDKRIDNLRQTAKVSEEAARNLQLLEEERQSIIDSKMGDVIPGEYGRGAYGMDEGQLGEVIQTGIERQPIMGDESDQTIPRTFGGVLALPPGEQRQLPAPTSINLPGAFPMPSPKAYAPRGSRDDVQASRGFSPQEQANIDRRIENLESTSKISPQASKTLEKLNGIRQQFKGETNDLSQLPEFGSEAREEMPTVRVQDTEVAPQEATETERRGKVSGIPRLDSVKTLIDEPVSVNTADRKVYSADKKQTEEAVSSSIGADKPQKIYRAIFPSDMDFSENEMVPNPQGKHTTPDGTPVIATWWTTSMAEAQDIAERAKGEGAVLAELDVKDIPGNTYLQNTDMPGYLDHLWVGVPMGCQSPR
jgi:hypothetical protein